MKEYIAKVEGMTCPHCAMKVKRALERVGYSDVQVSLERGEARFKSEDEVFFEEVAEVIGEIGYELVELKQEV